MYRLTTNNIRIRSSVGLSLSGLGLLALCSFLLSARAQERRPNYVSVMNSSLVLGETARITVVNDDDPDDPGGSEPISAQLKLFDAEGAEIYRSPAFVIPPGRFSYIDIDRGQLSPPGDSGTGRLQVLGKLILSVPESRLPPPDGTSNTIAFSEALVSLEIFDASTGATRVGHTLGFRHEHTRPE